MELSMFGLNESQVIVSGYPKNDILCNCSNEERKRIRKKLGIADGKKVILYAPTYRDISFGAMRCPVNFKRWESILGPNYIVFFRAHPVVANETKIDPSCSAVFDVSHYPDNMELMIASDVLISDYSGIFFEYAVLEKPMFCFAYDYEQYVKVRGLYFDIREELSGGFMNEEELLNYIKEASPREYETKLKMFRDKYVSEYGKATEICLSKIIKEIK